MPTGSATAGAPLLQPKLALGRVRDPTEQQADGMARSVLGMANVSARPAGEPAALRSEPVAAVAGRADAPPSVHAAVRSPSQPLDRPTRDFFEPRFQRDFGDVRVHTGNSAAVAARSIGALAFTAGTDVVFDTGRFAPGTESGNRLLAHELAHVVQQSGMAKSAVTGVYRQPDPKSPAQLLDPIAATDLPGYGFHAVGPEYSAVPQDADIRQVLGEVGIADAQTLGACSPGSFKVRSGDLVYFAYVHPNLGVVARAYAADMSPHPRQKDRVYSVYAYVADKDATRYRPPGGTGVTRQPIAFLEVMSDVSALRFTDLYAGLRLIEARLTAFADKYPTAGPSIDKARLDVTSLRSSASASAAQLQTLERALQLLEWAEHDLNLLDEQQTKLRGEKAPTTSIFALRLRYWKLIEKVLQPDAMATYEEIQGSAERLPIDVMLDALHAHGELNQELLKPSATLVSWTDDLRKRLDALYAKRQQLAANPGNAVLTKEIQDEAAFLEAAVRGIQLYAQRLVAFEQMLKGEPGVLDTPLVSAMNRLRDRVEKMRAAYDARDTKDLRTRVDSLENDESVKVFYRALPSAMNVTRLIAKVGVTTLVAIATGGVGGLLSGGARAAATGLTLRGALTFAGTAALEAATFTVLNTAASQVLFNEKITFGSMLKDFAWNLGLFFVLRGISGVSTTMLRAAELTALAGPVQLIASFPAAHAWGVLRFRIEQDRWPTKVELDQMTAQNIVMLAAIFVGSKGVQRYLEGRKTATSLPLFHREYGWRFEALETLRTKLGQDITKAELGGKGSDPAALDAAKANAKTLEEKFQALLDAVIKDKRFQIPQIREELNALRDTAPNVHAELLAEALGIPLDVGVRRAAKASYTYASGKTNTLESALAGNYTVTKKSDPTTGLKTVTAQSPKSPTLVFQERTAGALDLNTQQFDVQKLLLEFSLTDPNAQKVIWRMLSNNGMAKDGKQATIVTRRQVKELTRISGKSADETLRDLHKTGVERSTADKAVVAAADRLDKSGVLKSPEWLEARGTDNQRGVVGEWLAKETLPPPAGSRVLRRVTVKADLFEDAAGTIPAKSAEGKPRVNVTPVETDVVYARDAGGRIEVDMAINVKASAEKGMAKSASVQNANFQAILRAKPGDLVKLQLADGVRYASVRSITAVEGSALVDVTGKLTPSATMTLETVGPKGAAGFSQQLPIGKADISAVTDVLNETQLIRSGEY